nr:hypothetical protein [uncultured Gemmiger sp.]
MENQTVKNSRYARILRRLGAGILILLCLGGIRILLGSRQMMYLSATDIDHIDVTITPPGTTLTSVGDDSAEAVKILSQTVCYFPRSESVAGQAVTLTIYKHNGTTMTVTSCGNHCTIDGKAYRVRSSDGEALAQWALSLAEKQNVQS